MMNEGLGEEQPQPNPMKQGLKAAIHGFLIFLLVQNALMVYKLGVSCKWSWSECFPTSRAIPEPIPVSEQPEGEQPEGEEVDIPDIGSLSMEQVCSEERECRLEAHHIEQLEEEIAARSPVGSTMQKATLSLEALHQLSTLLQHSLDSVRNLSLSPYEYSENDIRSEDVVPSLPQLASLHSFHDITLLSPLLKELQHQITALDQDQRLFYNLPHIFQNIPSFPSFSCPTTASLPNEEYATPEQLQLRSAPIDRHLRQCITSFSNGPYQNDPNPLSPGAASILSSTIRSRVGERGGCELTSTQNIVSLFRIAKEAQFRKYSISTTLSSGIRSLSRSPTVQLSSFPPSSSETTSNRPPPTTQTYSDSYLIQLLLEKTDEAADALGGHHPFLDNIIDLFLPLEDDPSPLSVHLGKKWLGIVDSLPKIRKVERNGVLKDMAFASLFDVLTKMPV